MNYVIKNAWKTLCIAAVASIFAGCAKQEETPPGVLQYVPADTPYVFASTESIPDSLADKLEPTIDEVLEAYQRIIRHAMAEELVELSAEEGGAEKAEKLQALVDEVLGLMSIDGIRGAGIDRDAAFAFYGNGLLPVVRLELTEAAAFDSAIARIESKAENQLSVGELKGEEYKYLDVDKARLLIATLDDQAVISIAPVQFSDDQLARVLGITKPAKSLADSKGLESLSEQYGFSNYFSGYVNSQSLVGTFLGNATGLDKDLLAIFDYDVSDMSETCKSEFMEVAGIAPRMVFGYTDMNDEFIDSVFVVELRDDIAEGLATIPRPVPGLGQDFGGLMSFGFGVDLLKAREFYEARLDAIEADPFECDKLASMQGFVAMGRQALNQPVPPVVYSFQGMVAVISDIQGMDLAKQRPPESIDASFLLAIENAQSLVAMGAMMDPELASLNLMPDGKPVKLELAQLAEVTDEAYAALSDNALAVSMGEGSETKAAELLVADSKEPAPLFSMTMDTASYYGLIGDAMMHSEPKEGEEEMPLAVRTALKDVMTLMGQVYRRMALDVRLTPKGIEMRSRLLLAD